MITYLPRAASIPAISAPPYPRMGAFTTRAPFSVAIRCEPSVLPLSDTTTSPATPSSSSERRAFRTQTASVSASFRHGSRTVTSSWFVTLRFLGGRVLRRAYPELGVRHGPRRRKQHQGGEAVTIVEKGGGDGEHDQPDARHAEEQRVQPVPPRHPPPERDDDHRERAQRQERSRRVAVPLVAVQEPVRP